MYIHGNVLSFISNVYAGRAEFRGRGGGGGAFAPPPPQTFRIGKLLLSHGSLSPTLINKTFTWPPLPLFSGYGPAQANVLDIHVHVLAYL